MVASKRYNRKNFSSLQRQLQKDYRGGSKGRAVDPKTNFVFYDVDGKLHDRTCKCVSRLSSTDVEYFERIPEGRELCPCCNFTAIIRNGIRLGERVDVYINFFGKVGATLEDLKLLLLKNGAYLKWINFTTLRLKVHDDYWEIRCRGNSIDLYHNNYFVDENGERIFGSGFHHQAVPGRKTFSNMCKVMLEYDWRKHLGLESGCAPVQNWVWLSDDKIAFVGRKAPEAKSLFSQEGVEFRLSSRFQIGESGFFIFIGSLQCGEDAVSKVMCQLGSMVGEDEAYGSICDRLTGLFGKPVGFTVCGGAV